MRIPAYKYCYPMRMKLTAVLALLVLAGCSRDGSRIDTDIPGLRREIGLRPMSGAPTRSAISGTAFPQVYDMRVSAYLNGATSRNYFSDAGFGNVDGIWKSLSDALYYPSQGTLDFLAVASAGYHASASGIAPSASWNADNCAGEVVLTVPDNGGKFDDLLFGALNGQSASVGGVPMEFRHAMTSVVFIARSNSEYNATSNSGITIRSITLDGAKYSGTLTVSNPGAGGGSGTLSASWCDLGSAREHLAARVWNESNTGGDASEPELSDFHPGRTASTLADKPFGDAYVILPPQAAVQISVNYTIHNGFTGGDTPVANDQDLTYRFTPEVSWVMGKKYVYQLDFRLAEIAISPGVVDWNTESAAVQEIDGTEDLVDISELAAGHGYVNLGLKRDGCHVLFADRYLGALSGVGYGDYYQWGETVPKSVVITDESYNNIRGGSFDWASTPFCTADDGSAFSKYNSTDKLTTLEAADDAASVAWGGGWHIPDRADLKLLATLPVEWTNSYQGSGMEGFVFSGNGNTLFLSAAGYCSGTNCSSQGYDTYLWSRTRSSSQQSAYYLSCTKTSPVPSLTADNDDARYFGNVIRPVLLVPENVSIE